MKKVIISLVVVVIAVVLVLGFLWWQKNNNPPTASDQSLAEIQKSGRLIIGVDYSYGVMEFFDEQGQPAGIDIDLGREIASRLGVQAEFKGFDWQNLFSLIEKKEVDLVLSSVTITADRAQRILFSSPYFNGGQVILTTAKNTDINTVEDLKNRKIGVQIDTTSQEAAEKITGQDLVITYNSWENPYDQGGLIYDLKAGKFDAIIVDYIQALESIKKDAGVKIVGTPFTQEYYGIATNLENRALMEAIDTALRDIKKEGVLKKIEDKWTKS
jgi:ABC-type amino acid transport substrate-binding protein